LSNDEYNKGTAHLAAHMRFEHKMTYWEISNRLRISQEIIKGWIEFYEAADRD
jgi:DNA-binding transcriptional regulator LsrR (DeoR family)